MFPKMDALVVLDLPEQSPTPLAFEPQDQGQVQSYHVVDCFVSTPPRLKLSSNPEVMVVGEEQQINGEASSGPTKEEAP